MEDRQNEWHESASNNHHQRNQQMPSINCLTCGYRQTEDIPARFAGRSVKCPQCRRRVEVMADASSEAIDFPIDDSPAIQTALATTSKPTVAKPLPSVGPPLKRRQKRNWVAYLFVAVVAFAAGLVASPHLPTGLHAEKELQKPQPQQVAANAPIAANARDPHEVLSAFIKENTNTGEWEEVRYWPPVSISTASHSNALLTAGLAISQRHGNDAYADALKLNLNAKGNPAIQFLRLKYRTQNEFGNQHLMDEVFVLQGDQISLMDVIEETIMQWAWEDLQIAEAGGIVAEPNPRADIDAVFGQNAEGMKEAARRLQRKGAK
jgi:hypothetical protein